jgi:hypothetical protein
MDAHVDGLLRPGPTHELHEVHHVHPDKRGGCERSRSAPTISSNQVATETIEVANPLDDHGGSPSVPEENGGEGPVSIEFNSGCTVVSAVDSPMVSMLLS